MRALFVGDNDWASCANRIASAISSADTWDARVITAFRHPFGYGQGQISSEFPGRPGSWVQSAASWLSESSSPWLFTTGDGSYGMFNNVAAELLRRGASFNRGALHVGSAFRRKHNRYNKTDSAAAMDVRFISADSMDLADTGAGSVDMPYVHCMDAAPNSEIITCEPFRIVHSPSNRLTKGTDIIIRVVERLIAEGVPATFDLIEGVSYSECKRRRRNGHIFIGQINPEIGGFGYSCVEAASEGLLPIASLTGSRVGERFNWERFGVPTPPVKDASCEKSLDSLLRRLCSNVDAVAEGRAEALRWTSTGSASTEWAQSYYSEALSRASRIQGCVTHTINDFGSALV